VPEKLKVVKLKPPSSLKRTWLANWKQIVICQILKLHYWSKWKYSHQTNIYAAGKTEENAYPVDRKFYYKRTCALCGEDGFQGKRA